MAHDWVMHGRITIGALVTNCLWNGFEYTSFDAVGHLPRLETLFETRRTDQDARLMSFLDSLDTVGWNVRDTHNDAEEFVLRVQLFGSDSKVRTIVFASE